MQPVYTPTSLSRPLPVRVMLRVGLGLLGCILNFSLARPLGSQQPPPPPAPPQGRPRPPRLDVAAVTSHLQAVRRHLEEARPRDTDAEKLVEMARRALNTADQNVQAKDFFGADRRIAGADDLLHAAEHPSHLAEGPKGPVPREREIADHLQRVYFRLQQADYFASTSGEPDARLLPSVARKFYERARKAYDTEDWFAADEYAKSADDTIRGLENLAQAAVPEPPRPPRPL
jgi:hypothetical protein